MDQNQTDSDPNASNGQEPPKPNALENNAFEQDALEQDALGLGDFLNPNSDEGLSIDDLGRAYAELLNQGEDPYQQRHAATQLGEIQEIVDAETTLEQGDDLEVSPRGILEALLFVGTSDNRPLTSPLIASLMRGVSPNEIDDLVSELNDLYADEVAPYEIIRQKDGYRLVLRESYHSLRDRFYGRVRHARLSQSAIDVLSIVAYRQPVSKDEVDEFRSQNSGTILLQLVKRKLLQVVPPNDGSQIKRYATTPRFLKLLRLQSLDDLPKSEDVDRWSG